MRPREWSVCVGAPWGVAVSGYVASVWLEAAPGWVLLAKEEPRTARYLAAAFVLPFPVVGAIVAGGCARFVEVHGLTRHECRHRRDLPPYPFDPETTQLVIGEVHDQDGSRSENSRWLVLPEKGMYTGLLVTGATGSAKTSAAQYPFTAQLIHLHAGDPLKKMADSSSTPRAIMPTSSGTSAKGAGRLGPTTR